jgi:lipoprotein-anchoring transpeptidase ErfK/SrfK
MVASSVAADEQKLIGNNMHARAGYNKWSCRNDCRNPLVRRFMTVSVSLSRSPFGSLAARPRLFAIAMTIMLIGGLSLILSGPARSAGTLVRFDHAAAPGTIVVKTGEKRLYFVLQSGRAIGYKVGVGRVGRQWSGSARIDGMYIAPNWAPPAAVRLRQPSLPDVVPSGAPNNPLGAAAMTLSGGGQYAIHGTNAPDSIGRLVSYGCIRMLNEDISDLYARVGIGSLVIVEP